MANMGAPQKLGYMDVDRGVGKEKGFRGLIQGSMTSGDKDKGRPLRYRFRVKRRGEGTKFLA